MSHSVSTYFRWTPPRPFRLSPRSRRPRHTPYCSRAPAPSSRACFPFTYRRRRAARYIFPSPPESRVAGGRDPRVLLIDQPNPIAKFLQHRARAVGGSVVDDDHLEGLVEALREALSSAAPIVASLLNTGITTDTFIAAAPPVTAAPTTHAATAAKHRRQHARDTRREQRPCEPRVGLQFRRAVANRAQVTSPRVSAIARLHRHHSQAHLLGGRPVDRNRGQNLSARAESLPHQPRNRRFPVKYCCGSKLDEASSEFRSPPRGRRRLLSLCLSSVIRY